MRLWTKPRFLLTILLLATVGCSRLAGDDARFLVRLEQRGSADDEPDRDEPDGDQGDDGDGDGPPGIDVYGFERDRVLVMRSDGSGLRPIIVKAWPLFSINAHRRSKGSNGGPARSASAGGSLRGANVRR